jgi:LCP family protein required for cell wall assembly
MALVLVAVVGMYWWANSIFGRIERVDVSEVLASGGDGTNYLIVGSDTREVLDPNDPELAEEQGPAGQRSDTMMVLRFEGGKAKLLSIPRDLYVSIAETDKHGKINAAYNGGPKRLIQTISDNLGINITRYIEVDFVSFAGLVDGLGGITINFEHPAYDLNSGLNVADTGPVKLDGEQALGYVRSRHYVEIIDGEEVEDPTADLGRIQRQQQFLQAVFAKLGDTGNPFTLATTASKVTDGLRIDDKMSLIDAMRFAWRLRGLTPEPQKLETSNERNDSGAVLILDEEASKPILDQFR